MPHQNRVTPFSELVADSARGLVYGNRGCLHDANGAIKRRYGVRRWISCRLEFRGWQRGALVQPGKFTELFFLDEATAFAAGHRPCALCRNEDYRRFVAIWHELHPVDEHGANALDVRLHGERVASAGSGAQVQRRFEAPVETLPDGAFVDVEGDAFLVLGAQLLRWTPAGYDLARQRPDGQATVLTPPSLVEVLRRGWDGVVPLLHPSATRVATLQRRSPCLCNQSPTRAKRPGA